MNDPSSIVYADAQIARILESEQDRAASELFECYRTAIHWRESFVAALIGRVCIAHARAPRSET